MNKKVKAPAGYHWMKSGSSYKLMKHSGKFKPHRGASRHLKRRSNCEKI